MQEIQSFKKNQIDICVNIERSIRYNKGKNERYKVLQGVGLRDSHLLDKHSTT
jgi:hypothetical protein